MIKKVIVTNDGGESLELELAGPEKSGLAITSIEGLGPVKATINSTPVVTSDVSLFNSSRLNNRNIVLNLRYYPRSSDDLVEDVRLLTYKYFPIKKYITLEIHTDARTAYARGYVEANEPDIFSEASSCQISVICVDPHFYDSIIGENSAKFYGIQPKFEFPFDNNSLEEPLLEMGNIASIANSINVINNIGDTEVGMIIEIEAGGTVINPTIINVGTGESMTIDVDKVVLLTGEGFINGDKITINTNKGVKSVTLLRGTTEYNILPALTSFSTWFTLTKGKNEFYFDAKKNKLAMNVSYTYTITYEGL